MNIYVVEGAAGCYSDHTQWPVKAFKEKRLAEDYMSLLNFQSSRVIEEFNKTCGVVTPSVDKLLSLHEDRNYRLTGIPDYETSYYVYELELED